MSKVHHYRCRLDWTGSTTDGYDAYDRTHQVGCPPAGAELELSSDPAFLGNPDLLNPERLLVAAASSCQMLSFLAYAGRARIDVLSEGVAEDQAREGERQQHHRRQDRPRGHLSVQGDRHHRARDEPAHEA